MIVYRITKCVYADDLSGTGARLYGGRWNSIGKSMLYTASSRSLAVLEALVHIPAVIMPKDFCMATLEVPDDITTITQDQLPERWQEYPESDELTKVGDRFINEAKTLLLCVPSAIVKEECNYLINPKHPSASSIKILSIEPFNFDERLL